MTVAVRAALLMTDEGVPMHNLLNRMVKGTQLAHQTLSLLINIYATSIIALKAWCVRVDSVFGTHLLTDDTTRAHNRKCRKFLMKSGMGVRTPTQTVRILGLLVESGMIYILIGVSSASVYKLGS
jgi:hypothetical protein